MVLFFVPAHVNKMFSGVNCNNMAFWTYLMVYIKVNHLISSLFHGRATFCGAFGY